MHNIELLIKTAKLYLKLPAQLRKRINTKLHLIAAKPYAKYQNVKPLKGTSGYYCLKVDDWRVIYEIEEIKLKIYVIKIEQRKEIYKL